MTLTYTVLFTLALSRGQQHANKDDITVFVMAPLKAFMDNRNVKLRDKCIESSKSLGYETIVHENFNEKFEVGAFLDAYDFMEKFAPNKYMVLLQHSTELKKPVHEANCDIETVNTQLPQTAGISSSHQGMIWASRVVRESLNVSCGLPCSGPKMKIDIPKWQCFRDGTLLVSPNGRKIIKPVVDYLRNNMSPISKLESEGWERLGGILSAYVCIVTRSCGIEEMEHVQRKVDLFFESMHPESKNCSKLSLKEYSPFQYMTKRADLYDFCMRDHASALREQARVATELEYEVASVRANYGNCAQGIVLKNHGHVPTAPKQTSAPSYAPNPAPSREPSSRAVNGAKHRKLSFLERIAHGAHRV